jgi:hypothetical protein
MARLKIAGMTHLRHARVGLSGIHVVLLDSRLKTAGMTGGVKISGLTQGVKTAGITIILTIQPKIKTDSGMDSKEWFRTLCCG